MVPKAELKKIAKARLSDAEVLLRAHRYDGALYLCGYAVEIALKARICETLGWPGYPSTRAEFEKLASFKTHDLDILLRLSGIEAKLKTKSLTEWSTVASWDPDVRYRSVGAAKKKDVRLMVDATKKPVRNI